jgi:spore coat polysaccharide biosynthesis protein SpsF
MTRRIRAIVQARMGSSRLPGKSMADLAGMPMLARVVGRLEVAGRWIGTGWQVHVASTTLSADDRIEQWCRENGVPCFRGDPLDVLDRFAKASADLAPHETIVRATADNPFYCPVRTASIVAQHLQTGADYTGIFGLSAVVPEVMQVAALRQIAAATVDPYCREHVTPQVRRGDGNFTTAILPPDWHGMRPHIRLTVDTPVDLQRARRIAESCGANAADLTLERIYAFCRREQSRQLQQAS